MVLSKRKYVLFAIVIAVFVIGYGFLDISNNVTSIRGYASAGVQECGCKKCHSIELNNCKGCHSSKSTTSSERASIEDEAIETLESSSNDLDSGDTESGSDPGIDPSNINDNNKPRAENGTDNKRQTNKK